MATSELKKFVDIDTSLYGAQAPLSTHYVRSLTNNANHLADEDAQILVASPSIDNVNFNTYVEDIDSTDYKIIWRSGRLVLKLRSDNTCYPVRVRLKYRNGSSTSQSIAIGLIPYGSPIDSVMLEDGALSSTYEGMATANVTSTTDAWVSFTFNSGATNIVRAGSLPFIESTAQYAPGGNSVKVTEGELVIIGKAASGTQVARPTIIYAAQYIGTD